MIKFLALAGFLTLANPHPIGFEETLLKYGVCGYPSCPSTNPNMINVHLVPHTHDDVGWLKTVDQYYFGSKNQIQNAGVQYIIDSVVSELLADSEKKFIYVETSFFWRWWNEQSEKTKLLVKGLVNRGQLEFIGGGWTMNDEATTYYQTVIDQFTWGFRKLNDTFGICGQPKIGWQIDPFGHSKEMASIMAQLGFDGLFFGRLDYQEKKKLMEKRGMEMVWEADSSLGLKGDIFTGVLYNLYQAPKGFCFDVMCGDEPIIDDVNSPEYNVPWRVGRFLEHIFRQSIQYKTNNIMLTMGGDFNYLDAHHYFKNLEKLIRYVNDFQKKGSNVNVFYSTPSCYVKSLHEANVTWPARKDDFFPYASAPHAYWTGYFTSRPTLKYFERQGNNHLQVCKQLAALAKLGPEKVKKLDYLREAMGMMQHHDAITGTEKQHVANDYARILTSAIEKCDQVTSAALNKIATNNNPKAPPLTFTSCLQTNISECDISAKSNKFLVTVYNPLSRPVDYLVRLPVKDNRYTVIKPDGVEAISQVVPIPDSLINIPGRKSQTTMELLFRAQAIPPLGYAMYFVTSVEGSSPPEKESIGKEVTLGSNDAYVVIDTSNGQITRANFKGIDVPMSQQFRYYEGTGGTNNHFDNQASGAYIFRPDGKKTYAVSKGDPTFAVYKGPIVHEIQITYSEWASQVIRHYANRAFVEVEWLLGPIPVEDDFGKEVVTQYTTDLDNKGVFYTDSNGRQTIERKKDFRPTWNVTLSEPIAGNYYPITTDISINDGDVEFIVFTDRAQGGTSLEKGQIEIMLHRRLLHDDGFGVGEALNEMAYGKGLVARGRHWLLAGKRLNPLWSKKKRLFQKELVLSPQVSLTDLTDTFFDPENYLMTYTGLEQPILPEVQVLTLEPWKDNRYEKTYLIRLEHIFDRSENNKTLIIKLGELFKPFQIVSLRETALGADRYKDYISKPLRLQWFKESPEIFEVPEPMVPPKNKTFPVVLSPKQIRTFICYLENY